MIQLIEYTPSMQWKDDLKQIYLNAFPLDERRDWHEILTLTQHPPFNLYNISDNRKSIGMISVWRWPELTFIEHFAIHDSMQGKGIGSEVLNLVIKEVSTPLIVEVEEPSSEGAMRRIALYQRLGFAVCHEVYYQPPYSPGKNAVKMLLMSYPRAITQAEFIIIKTKLYKEVYQRNITEFP